MNVLLSKYNGQSYLYDELDDFAEKLEKECENKYTKKQIKTRLVKCSNIEGCGKIIINTEIIDMKITINIFNEMFRDDEIDTVAQRRTEQVRKILSIEYPKQRSKEWFDIRNTRISASDGGLVFNKDKYKAQFNFIIDKIKGRPFEPNIYCHHGCKYESIATMLYEYYNNVKVAEVGFICHETIDFIGASPDGIISEYKKNGVNKTKYVGKLIEIKCPPKRKILSGVSVEQTCVHYWIQMQLQLECCNLDECDFIQCDIKEYNSREDFINNTDDVLEKGCVIQLLPFDKLNEINKIGYDQTIYAYSSYIYPPRIKMSNKEIDSWVLNTLCNLRQTHSEFIFDKIIYWKLMQYECELVREIDYG